MDRFRPTDLDLDRSKSLTVTWADGLSRTLPLTLVRQNCPCAECRAAREERAANPLAIVPGVVREADMVVALAAELVGQYALRIRWRDGHDTGIYDFRLLRSLCESPAAN